LMKLTPGRAVIGFSTDVTDDWIQTTDLLMFLVIVSLQLRDGLELKLAFVAKVILVHTLYVTIQAVFILESHSAMFTDYICLTMCSKMNVQSSLFFEIFVTD
jgi:hypothetical protein